jgi:hypothetical protein
MPSPTAVLTPASSAFSIRDGPGDPIPASGRRGIEVDERLKDILLIRKIAAELPAAGQPSPSGRATIGNKE